MKLFRLAILFVLLALAPAVCAQISGPATAIRFGPTDPSTCQAGQGLVFINTTSGLFKQCNTTDTWTAVGGGSGDALTTNPLSQFASTTSAQLAGVISNETGSSAGLLVFNDSPTLVSPAITTSLTTGSSTFALLNTTATTVNAFGAATTLNIGASATTILNFGGSTTAAEFRFLEPSGSGTNYSAFKAVAQGANITYSLPATVGAAGTVLTDAAGNGVLSWAAGGGGVTIGTTAITSGTATRLIYETSGNVVGEVSGVTSNGTAITATAGNLIATSPKFITDISDTNGNEVFKIVATGSAVNEFTVTNGATGSGPILSATGGDTDVSMTLSPKGAGIVATSIDDAATATVTDVLDIRHSSSGTPAVGFGAAIRFGLETTTTLNRPSGRIATTWTTSAAEGSQVSLMSFYAYNVASAVESLRLSSTAVLPQTVLDASAGGFRSVISSNGMEINITRFGTSFGSTHPIFWTSGLPTASADLGVSRNAAGVAEVNAGSANTLGKLLAGRVVTAKTSDYTVVTADKSTFFTNTGATGTVVFTLPTAVAGLTYEFFRDANFTVQVTAGASTTIRVGASVTAAAGNVTLDAVGSRIRLVAISATQWVGELTGTATFN